MITGWVEDSIVIELGSIFAPTFAFFPRRTRFGSRLGSCARTTIRTAHLERRGEDQLRGGLPTIMASRFSLVFIS